MYFTFFNLFGLNFDLSFSKNGYFGIDICPSGNASETTIGKLPFLY
jgi:hypothetical protein